MNNIIKNPILYSKLGTFSTTCLKVESVCKNPILVSSKPKKNW